MFRLVSILLVIHGSFSTFALAQNQTPPNPLPSAPVILTATLPCQWKLDGVPEGALEYGSTLHLRLILGKHVLEATSDDGIDRWEQNVDVPGQEEMGITIGLASVRAVRLEASALTDIMRTLQNHVEAWGERKAFRTVEISRFIADPHYCHLSWQAQGWSKKVRNRNGNRSIDLRQISDSQVTVADVQDGGSLYYEMTIFTSDHDFTTAESLFFSDKPTVDKTVSALKEAITICNSGEWSDVRKAIDNR